MWDHEETFKTLKEAKAYLKEEYPHKRKPMYVDKKDGSTIKTGYVYSKKSKYDDTHKTFIEEIWVSFYEVKPVILGGLN